VATSEIPYDESEPSGLHPGEKARGARGRGRRPKEGQDGVHHTRIGRAWGAVIVAAVLGVALVDFIVQNTRSVRIEFFGASGQIPVAVALLGAALVGAFIVLAVGIARTTQLRIATRRGKKREKKAESLTASREG
jgi:lipopolysaccharide assembly protein A